MATISCCLQTRGCELWVSTAPDLVGLTQFITHLGSEFAALLRHFTVCKYYLVGASTTGNHYKCSLLPPFDRPENRGWERAVKLGGVGPRVCGECIPPIRVWVFEQGGKWGSLLSSSVTGPPSETRRGCTGQQLHRRGTVSVSPPFLLKLPHQKCGVIHALELTVMTKPCDL